MAGSMDYAQLAIVLNSSVIVLCTIMKVPQIMAVLRNGTTKGINVLSLFMEFWCFTQILAYSCSKGYPISGYAEFLLLAVQDTVLIFLMLRENRRLDVLHLSAFVLYISFVASLAFGYFPPNVNSVIIMTVTPMSAAGKIMQLLTIVRNRSAGSVSPASWGIAAYTAGAKLCTNYLTVHDVVLMVTSGQACCLNLSICVSAVVFKDPKPSTDKEEN